MKLCQRELKLHQPRNILACKDLLPIQEVLCANWTLKNCLKLASSTLGGGVLRVERQKIGSSIRCASAVGLALDSQENLIDSSEFNI